MPLLTLRGRDAARLFMRHAAALFSEHARDFPRRQGRAKSRDLDAAERLMIKTRLLRKEIDAGRMTTGNIFLACEMQEHHARHIVERIRRNPELARMHLTADGDTPPAIHIGDVPTPGSPRDNEAALLASDEYDHSPYEGRRLRYAGADLLT